MTSTIPNTELEKIQQPLQAANNDEIDLREVGRTIGRHRLLVAGTTTSLVLLSGLNTLSQKPVWEGQFQIVLEENQPTRGALPQAFNANPLLAQFAGISGSNSSLETQVKILESPSVLLPVFNFVKKQKVISFPP